MARVDPNPSSDSLVGVYAHTAEHAFRYRPTVHADGTSSIRVAKQLHKNALVRQLDYRVSASRATSVVLGDVATLRPPSGSTSTLIADFLTLRTVAGFEIESSAPDSFLPSVSEVSVWNGREFVSPPAFVSSSTASFPEVRTDRVKITFSANLAVKDLARWLAVVLPDAPADLEIRFGDGVVVWSAPGTVEPGVGGWSETGDRIAPLGPAFATLTGDPTGDAQTLSFEVVLSSRLPGLLDLEEETADIAYLAQLELGPRGHRLLTFEQEGEETVTLQVPSWVGEIEEVSLTLFGSVGDERIIPALGPRATDAGTPRVGAAKLVLDLDHSACVRLPVDSGLAELTGLRLSLSTDAAGAEVSVVLLEDQAGEPGPPLKGGASEPVSIQRSAEDDPWVRFSFPDTVKLDPGRPLWAAVMVTRGRATWPLGEFETRNQVNPLRRGPPGGPWHPLPALVLQAEVVGGRVRLVGRSVKNLPLPPMRIGLSEPGASPARFGQPALVAGTLATPAPDGTKVTLALSDSPMSPRADGDRRVFDLSLTSHAVGSFRVEDVKIVATRPGANA